MEGINSTRNDTTELARQIRIKAQQLEKISISAADAVDRSTPKPAIEASKPAPDGNLINDTLRGALRAMRRVEENLNELHSRLGNPFGERGAGQTEDVG